MFARATAACGEDIEMRAHWARYLCVLSAGFIENAVKAFFADFVHAKASEPVANFASSQIRQIQNPKTKRILEIAGSFKEDWRESLDTFVGENGRREAIDSIMQNRHLIAHGQSAGVTLAQVRRYFDLAVEVLAFIEKKCTT